MLTCRDVPYMERALQLARAGLGHVSPNPMVGAVIVAPDGRIIGEGWHRRYGGPHAEVNAVASVSAADEHLLHESTIYVTLEPCSHYGKTPPCAKLLIEKAFRRVVIGADDPNPKVNGRGTAMLRQAGIEVDTGLLADRSEALNRTFMTSQRLRRPFVTLKWAQSADGFMDADRAADPTPFKFSTALSSQVVHMRRATHDAIAVGARTVMADNPSLTTRLVAGHDPRPVIFDRHGLLAASRADLLSREGAIVVPPEQGLPKALGVLFADYNISSLLVEGGASLLSSFIDAGLWDEAYVEIAPERLGARGRVAAPAMPCLPLKEIKIDKNRLLCYSRVPLSEN